MTQAEGGSVVILGVTSPIGRAVAMQYARQGTSLVVSARDPDELERTAADLALRSGAAVVARRLDASRLDGSEGSALESWWADTEAAAPGVVRGVVVCWGDMPEQAEAQDDGALLRRMIQVNYTAAVLLLEAAARSLEARGAGFLCAITSVAGDRGRASNYLYGSTKAALSAVLSGLRQRLAAAGVAVVDVRPGFVDTGLTWGRDGVFLVAKPERVAAAIVRGVRQRRAVVYTPWFWRFVMLAIRAIPEAIFVRLPL